MTDSLPGRRALAESLYLLTAPATDAVGLLAACAGLCRRGRRPGRREWLEVAHAVVVLPVASAEWAVTVLWWFAGLAAATSALRHPYMAPGHVILSTALGLLILATLPLVTRACVQVRTRLRHGLLDAVYTEARAEDRALRRLERDIHDGPQQRLVRLALDLGRAQHHFDSKPQAARDALADAIVQAQDALEELRALSRGITPPLLADRGLGEAITALASFSAVPADVDAAPLDRRLDPGTETTAYFVVAEALTNVAKHSNARHAAIGLRHVAGTLLVWVSDDGAGGAALDKGHGLRGLDDRLRAAGGQLLVSSPAGGPTTITATLPCC